MIFKELKDNITLLTMFASDTSSAASSSISKYIRSGGGRRVRSIESIITIKSELSNALYNMTY